MSGQHAPLPPSSAHIWFNCPASVGMQASYPEPDDTEEAREGTAAHHYATEGIIDEARVPVGSNAPNGYPITQEMADCAQGFIADVRDVYWKWKADGGDPQLFVEQRVDMPLVHEQNWGTPDAAIVDVPMRRLYINDYKFGHRFVDAPGNLQLLDYAIGHMPRESAEWPLWTITIVVSQPRNFHRYGPVRRWETNGRELLDNYRYNLSLAAKEAMGPDPEMRTGEHCRDCSARHACPALQQAAAIAMDVSRKDSPLDLTAHALGLELRQLDEAAARIKARRTGLEEQALGLIRGGTNVPHFTAQHSVGREKWDVPDAEAILLAKNFGVDISKGEQALTPNQARDAFKKQGVDGTVIKSYSTQPRGALRLERADDNEASLAFS